MSYIYCKVEILVTRNWYTKGEVYDCAYWNSCVTPLNVNDQGYFYSYGSGILKDIPIQDIKFLIAPDI